MKKKTLGIILSVMFALVFLGVLILDSGLIVTLAAIGGTAIVFGAVFLCVYLITSDE